MLTIALLVAFIALAGLDIGARAGADPGEHPARPPHGGPGHLSDRLTRGAVAGARSQMLARLRYVPPVRHRRRHSRDFRPAMGADLHLRHLRAAPAGSALLPSSRRCYLIAMALINEWLVRRPLTEVNEAASRNYAFTEMSLRNCGGGAGDGHDAAACCSAGGATATDARAAGQRQAIAPPRCRASSSFCACRCNPSFSGSAPIW